MSELVGMRALAQQQQAAHKAMERLATGKRINRASDDPSGLIVANSFAARGASIVKEIERLELASIKAQAKEGALSVVQDLYAELGSLVVRAANRGALGEGEREALQIEADGIIDAIEFLHNTTRFRGELVFAPGSFESIGATQWSDPGEGAQTQEPDKSESPEPSLDQPSQTTVTLSDLRTGGALNLIDGNLELAQQVVGGVAGGATQTRAALGAQVKYFYEKQISALQRELEGVQSSESVIRDADFAVETVNLVRSQVLAQAAISAILISRRQAGAALGLLG